MTCHGHTSMHDGLDPRQFMFNGRSGRQTTVLCRGCAAVIESMGSGWTLDRRSDPARADRYHAFERLPAALDDARTPRPAVDSGTPCRLASDVAPSTAGQAARVPRSLTVRFRRAAYSPTPGLRQPG
jgi:hypothetical protein